jgi:hemoglobin
MRDIETRQDIEELMIAFYSKALNDDLIGYIFTDVAKLDLEHHLPIIVDFWEMVLFQTINFQEKYGRSPMSVHLKLNEKTPLKREHFTRWLQLFDKTIDKSFNGENANSAKLRAVSIANTMLIKITQQNSEGVQILR